MTMMMVVGDEAGRQASVAKREANALPCPVVVSVKNSAISMRGMRQVLVVAGGPSICQHLICQHLYCCHARLFDPELLPRPMRQKKATKQESKLIHMYELFLSSISCPCRPSVSGGLISLDWMDEMEM